MNKQDYETIIKNLDNVIKECESLAEKFQSRDSVLQWSVAEYQENCMKARELQSTTDQIFHGDLYHLIGMGNFTVGQATRFMAKIKVLTNTRSKLKNIAAFQEIKIPKVPTKAEYKCSVLCDKKLTKTLK